MASLPQKSIKGTLFKKWAVESIDKLIDFLSSPFIQAGKGIAVRRSGGITIIELEKPTATAQNVTNNTVSGADGIESSVSGGTASVTLTGGTGSVNFVGTGAVSISGNTNGEIEINATGGTSTAQQFPDYADSVVPISAGTAYPVVYDSWLIGTVGLYKTDSSAFPTEITLHILNQTGTTTVRSLTLFADTGTFMGSYVSYNNFKIPVFCPIRGGGQIEIYATGSYAFDLSLYNI